MYKIICNKGETMPKLLNCLYFNYDFWEKINNTVMLT